MQLYFIKMIYSPISTFPLLKKLIKSRKKNSYLFLTQIHNSQDPLYNSPFISGALSAAL